MTEPRMWQLAHGRTLELGAEARIMGVINVTPDSFSDGGLHLAAGNAVAAARAMAAAGAAIIDVGGESTRPGAQAIDAAEEQRRVLPVIEALAGDPDIILSIDTYRAETARLAVAAGAHIVNDVWGLQKDAAMAEGAARTGAGLVVMHTGRERKKLPDVIADQFAFLRSLVGAAGRHDARWRAGFALLGAGGSGGRQGLRRQGRGRPPPVPLHRRAGGRLGI
jgi:dihydropteroate synthase